jgi:hypothetical protein
MSDHNREEEKSPSGARDEEIGSVLLGELEVIQPKLTKQARPDMNPN